MKKEENIAMQKGRLLFINFFEYLKPKADYTEQTSC